MQEIGEIYVKKCNEERHQQVLLKCKTTLNSPARESKIDSPDIRKKQQQK